MLNLRENLESVRNKINHHAPNPAQIKIEAVTKSQDPQVVQGAIQLGINILGVNYVQEGELLREKLNDETIQWHFIGHIQSRKTKNLLDFSLIESVDRLEIAEDLNRRALAKEKNLVFWYK